MGANNFETTGKGKTVQDAFDEARRDALHWYGHRGYTGSLAEKGEYIVIPESEYKGKYDPRWYAQKLMDDQDERIDDKWGPAGAIKLDDENWLFFGWASS